jgi:tetraprenyl-beta-curcumene synthase
VFALAALRYWLTVYPRVARELARWRRRAARIPDARLRALALAALAKRGNLEGAAAFAAFVPPRRRGAAVRALVAFQAAYNHADLLAEQPCADPVGEARRLHEVLLAALDLDAAPAADTMPALAVGSDPATASDRPRPLARYVEFPAHTHAHAESPAGARAPAHGPDDGGYLADLAGVSRAALRELPSHAAVIAPARAAAARIVDFQSLGQDERDALERWARALTPTGGGLRWWETAAAAGSSLAVLALIAAAAGPPPLPGDLEAIDRAYSGPIGALHSLLDSLVDEAEDAATGQLSLVGCYRSREDATARMRWLAARALDEAHGLPNPRHHMVLTVAMICHYLSAPTASSARARMVAGGVREALGRLAWPALLVFRARDARAA